MAEQLHLAASRVILTTEVAARLKRIGRALGANIVGNSSSRADSSRDRPHIASVLAPGARICFTGTAYDSAGNKISKEELEALAKGRGLEPVKTVTKSKCEVLIAAELGTQSNKRREAAKFNKPVYEAAEFLAWLARTR